MPRCRRGALGAGRIAAAAPLRGEAVGRRGLGGCARGRHGLALFAGAGACGGARRALLELSPARRATPFREHRPRGRPVPGEAPAELGADERVVRLRLRSFLATIGASLAVHAHLGSHGRRRSATCLPSALTRAKASGGLRTRQGVRSLRQRRRRTARRREAGRGWPPSGRWLLGAFRPTGERC